MARRMITSGERWSSGCSQESKLNGLLSRGLQLRGFVPKLILSSLAIALATIQALPRESTNGEIAVSFTSVARQVGLTTPTIYGDEHKNKYLLETTGCGAAFLDYDNDGWQDILLINGTRLAGLPQAPTPTNRLYHNNGDGTFTDVTEKAKLTRTGWGQSVAVGDYDND